jgi:hypothetical protein
MIRNKTLLILLLGAALCLPAISQGGISIELGDRGYYNHGDSYVNDGYTYVWIPGHWNSRHNWVHGHYARRGRAHVGIGVGVGGVYIHP